MKSIVSRVFLRTACLLTVAVLAGTVFAARKAEDQPVGLAVTIGLNRLDAGHYGTTMALRGCVNDAQDIRAIARLKGFTCPASLVDDKATRKAVIDAIKVAAAQLKSGDLFLLQYSGHGSSIPDLNKDEDDGRDETWCLYDGMLVDDELARLWSKFRPGVRILVLSDSCSSGTVTKGNAFNAVIQAGDDQFRGIVDQPQEPPVFRFLPDDKAAAVYRANKQFYELISLESNKDETGAPITVEPESGAAVVLISGCQDNQLSADLQNNGLFTAALKQVWDNGKFTGGYRSFHSEIVRRMPQTQSPNFYPTGTPDVKFWKQRPFAL